MDRERRTAAPEPPKTPKRQERGRRRIESILDSAEEVIAEVGYDAATTNLIAARAGISPGSLYQYFANKPAIVEALAQRYVSDLARTHAGLDGAGLADRPLAEVVDRVVDPVIAFNRAHPAARFLLAGVDVSPDLARSTRALHEAVCDRVEALIGELAPHRPARDRRLVATVSFHVFGGLLPTVLAACGRERSRVTRELKAVIVAYWTDFIGADRDAGPPPPPAPVGAPG